MTQDDSPDLAIVMPVYNEAGNIKNVVSDWLNTLRRLKIPFSLIAINDGSKDNSLTLLNELSAHNPEIKVIDKENSGHGPSVLQGYRSTRATWLFQVDSDNEITAHHFPDFWNNREQYDFLLGRRMGRRMPLTRRLVSAGAKWTVRILCGSPLSDVNCPYRLFRRDVFVPLMENLPANTFGPNVIFSGWATKNKLRTLERPVTFQERTIGQSSIYSWPLLKAALRSFFQTLTYFLTHR